MKIPLSLRRSPKCSTLLQLYLLLTSKTGSLCPLHASFLLPQSLEWFCSAVSCFERWNCGNVTVDSFIMKLLFSSSLYQYISLRLNPFSPPISPDLRKRGGDSQRRPSGATLGPDFEAKMPLEIAPKTRIFSRLRRYFCTVFPLEITKTVIFSGRRRRIFAQNTLRNHQRSRFFRPPEAVFSQKSL